jgi:hypothetical protein
MSEVRRCLKSVKVGEYTGKKYLINCIQKCLYAPIMHQRDGVQENLIQKWKKCRKMVSRCTYIDAPIRNGDFESEWHHAALKWSLDGLEFARIEFGLPQICK